MNWVKKNSLTVGLALLLALLGGFYFWSGRQPAATSEISLWSLAEATPSLVTLTSPSKTAVYRKEGRDWRFSGNSKRSLDSRWEAGLPSLLKPNIERKLTAEVKWADYGLDQPSLKVSLGGKTLLLGRKNPSGTSYYGAEQGKRDVYLFPSWQVDSWLELLNTPPVAPSPR